MKEDLNPAGRAISAFLLRVKNAADSLLPRSIEAQAEDLVRAMQGRARR